jgi:hypothetical protein
VNAEEIDVALEELESRLERLRSLYEQYFLGFEKVEPTVARKDVDRRVWILRREKIRNTAKRFKLQTIIQRYNTFQQYWQRICREIENGTYKRHLLRAEKMFGSQPMTIAAKRRAGAYRRAEANTAEQATEVAVPAPAPAAVENAAALPEPAQPAPAVPPARAVPPPLPARRTAPARLDLDLDFGAGLPAVPPAARVASPTLPRPPARAVEPPAVVAPARVAPAPVPAAAPARPVPARSPALVAPAGGPPPLVRPKPRAPQIAAPNATGALSEQRVQELHARLVAAKRQTQDSSAISIDGLGRSLRAAENKLRAQHGNRQIDFDVVIKNGKAVVRPILK